MLSKLKEKLVSSPLYQWGVRWGASREVGKVAAGWALMVSMTASIAAGLSATLIPMLAIEAIMTTSSLTVVAAAIPVVAVSGLIVTAIAVFCAGAAKPLTDKIGEHYRIKRTKTDEVIPSPSPEEMSYPLSPLPVKKLVESFKNTSGAKKEMGNLSAPVTRKDMGL